MSERYEFRDFTISRSLVPHKDDYRKYKRYLRVDFKNRCGYCNAIEKQITPFHADHFIPMCKCVGQFSYLKNAYKNLVFSCPVCNRYKSSQFEGDLEADPYSNSLFYNPIETDFRFLFYRNKYGVICSDDSKGIDMIIRLRLYSSLHAIEWALERINRSIEELDRVIGQIGGESKSSLSFLNGELFRLFRLLTNIYEASYNSLASQVVEE